MADQAKKAEGARPSPECIPGEVMLGEPNSSERRFRFDN